MTTETEILGCMNLVKLLRGKTLDAITDFKSVSGYTCYLMCMPPREDWAIPGTEVKFIAASLQFVPTMFHHITDRGLIDENGNVVKGVDAVFDRCREEIRKLAAPQR